MKAADARNYQAQPMLLPYTFSKSRKLLQSSIGHQLATFLSQSFALCYLHPIMLTLLHYTATSIISVN